MRKILIAPLLIITIIVLIIWVIYPMYSTDSAVGGGVREKKLVLADEQDKMSKVDGAMKTADALYSEINSTPDDSKVLFAYVSKNREEENLIESVNSLATGNNLFVVNISVLDSKDKVLDQNGSEMLLMSPQASGDNADPALVQQEMEDKVNSMRINPRNLDVSVSVAGGYQDIKSFINKMNGLKRFNQVSSLLIKKLNEITSTGESVSTNKLQADRIFRFNYTKELDKVYNFDVNDPVFASQTIDKTVLDDIRKKDTDVLKVELKQDGNTNPFAE